MNLSEEIEAMGKRPLTEKELTEFNEAFNVIWDADKSKLKDIRWICFEIYDLGITRGIREERQRKQGRQRG